MRPSPLNPDVAVVEDQGTGIDAEVVLGYARFFRRHTPDPARFRGAASVAVGVTSLTAPKLDVLQSVHMGLELGFGDLSIGPAFVFRKVPALPGALQPGSVVKPGTTVTPDTVWQPGVALGIYATSLFKGGT